MSVSVEIEVEKEDGGCNGQCECGGKGMAMDAKPEPTKDELIAELKGLLNQTGSNGLAERQMKIDELMAQISEMGD